MTTAAENSLLGELNVSISSNHVAAAKAGIVFFNRSYLMYAPHDSGPNILVFVSDYELSEIRIRPFLSALLARGIIASYQFVDRKMRLMGWLKTVRFTHIWCHRNISTAQFRFLKAHSKVPIIYDIDDLLTDIPEFVMKHRPATVKRIEWCLERAHTVTTSTDRLKGLLSRRVSQSDIIVLKNGCDSRSRPSPSVKKHVIWTSGDVPFVLKDHPDFMEMLAKLLNRHGYEMILIGRFDPRYAPKFDRCRHIQRLDFHSYREFLRFYAGSLALAPLPSGLPERAQKYFDAKSDIKLVDYLSNGLIPISSSTPPYSESELFLPKLSAADPMGLLEKLEMCIENHSEMLAYVEQAIRGKGALERREYIELSKNLDSIFGK